MERIFFDLDLGKLKSILPNIFNINMVIIWIKKKITIAKRLKRKGASRDISSKVNKPMRRNNIATKNGKVATKVNKFCSLEAVFFFIFFYLSQNHTDSFQTIVPTYI